jgi:hypothetical protein
MNSPQEASLSQIPRTTTPLAMQELEDVAVVRGNGAEAPNWLSQLLARASHDDGPAGPEPELLRPGAEGSKMSPPNLSEKRAEIVPKDQPQRKAAAPLINLDELENELGVVTVDKDNFPSSWPDPNAALDTIKKTAEALSLMNERATAIEAYALKVIKQSREELAATTARASSCLERAVAAEEIARELQTRLSALEERALHSEERARHAEEEARNAKAWMVHVNNVITKTFSSVLRDFSSNLTSKDDVVGGIEGKLKNEHHA